MQVFLETDTEFTGVMYTKGSFYKKSEECFATRKEGNAKSLTMKFALNECDTLQVIEMISTVSRLTYII